RDRSIPDDVRAEAMWQRALNGLPGGPDLERIAKGQGPVARTARALVALEAQPTKTPTTTAPTTTAPTTTAPTSLATGPEQPQPSPSRPPSLDGAEVPAATGEAAAPV